MATELYEMSIPVFIRGLEILSALLAKGEAFAKEKGTDPAILTSARLIEDMAPLTAQIQSASDTAKGMAIRVGQLAPFPMGDTEQSFPELQERIAKTIAFLKSVPREKIDGREEAEVLFRAPNVEFSFTGRSYVLSFALPNFFFHVTTAYALLRHKGVPVGKLDFLGTT